MGCSKSRIKEQDDSRENAYDKMGDVSDQRDAPKPDLALQEDAGGAIEHQDVSVSAHHEGSKDVAEPSISTEAEEAAALPHQQQRRRTEDLPPAPPSDLPDPEALAMIDAWIGKQQDLKVARRHPRDKVADAMTAEALTYEKVVLADSSIFEGQLRGEDRHGWGKFTWDDGGAYEGQFDGNDMHGQGSYRWADGSVYVGIWTRNQMGPSGKMTWTDGREYSGEFVDGRKHGEGRIVWPDGRAYMGQWRSGKQHGFGTTVHSNGRERMSEWQHGTLVRWVEDREDFDAGKQVEEEARREWLAQR